MYALLYHGSVHDDCDIQQPEQQQHFSAEELAKMVDPEEVEEHRMRRMMEEVMAAQEQHQKEDRDHELGLQRAAGGEDIRSDPESEWDLHPSVASS